MTQPEPSPLSAIARLYSDSLGTHGTAAKGVGWGDETSHQLRFDKLAMVLEPPSEAISVIDLGCGYGALHGYLAGRGYRLSKFYGYDISEDMLREARRLVTAPEVEFISGAVIDRTADYVFASGIFNVRLATAEADWFAHISRTLDNMFEHATRGFAFNLLTSYVDWRADHLYYGDPRVFFDLCKTRYSRYVTLLHDYPLWEWTIVVRK